MKIILPFLFACLAVPVHAASTCKYPVIAELPITLVGTSLQPAVNGTIDGTPAVMLVDTGSWSSAMTMNGVQRRGLPLRITGKTAYGIGGPTTLYDVRLHELTAGAFRSGKTMVPVIASTGFAPSFDAIIGAPFLLSSDMEIRLAEKKLTFFQPDGCDDTYLGYWDEPSVELPFIYDKRQGTTPNPLFTIEINGKPVRAMIDTGAASTSISAQAAARIGIDPGNMRKAGMGSGIGEERVQMYRTHVDSVALGGEVIRNAELNVMVRDPEPAHDVMLGADFLRTHRVLFAMRQKKVYVAYLGGDVFPAYRAVAPWVRQEAEAGNPDAEMVMARAYGYQSGDAASEGGRWLQKAAAHGQPWAKSERGIQLMEKGKYADAVAELRAAMDSAPADRYAPFSLYQARVLAGQAALAQQELASSTVANGQRLWPTPVVDFYLGKADATALLKAAGEEPGAANFRLCEAQRLMAGWYHAHGDSAQEAAHQGAAKQVCAARS